MAVDAGTIYSEVRIDINKLNGDIKKIETRLDQFANKNKKQSKEVTQTWQDSFKKMGLAGVAAFAAIALAVNQAISIFAKYEQSMANVRSVTNATSEDFKALEEAAIEAGESTRFTATQAADALYFLASAGLSAEQSISALQGVLQLAGATQSDLASTSATMVATLAQFNLEVDESTRVSNVFAAAIANSQATMEKLSSALTKVGPISGAFGISLEETTANLEALFEAGLTGEESGTALRNIMLGLTQESGPLIAKLKELGIAFEDVNPQEVGLTDAIQNLATSGIDLAQVFERRTVAAILSLASTGGDALRELQADITDTNAAAEAYAIQNDTLAGSIDFLKSAMESASIELIKEFAPAIRGVVDFITDAVKSFNALPTPLKIAILTLGTAIPVIGGITFAVEKLKGAFVGMAGALAIVGGVVALAGVLRTMRDTAMETNLINTRLEKAVSEGQDLNQAMIDLSRSSGISLDKITDIAMQNENINAVLIEQNKLNAEMVTTYTNRVAALGLEYEINQKLLISAGFLGERYRQALNEMLDRLEAEKEELRLIVEKERLEEEAEEAARLRRQERERELEKLADIQEEFRRAQLDDQELAYDDLRIKRDEFLAAGIDAEEWYLGELAALREKFKAEEEDEDTGADLRAQQIEDTKKLIGLKERYQQKLAAIGMTVMENLEAEEALAIAAIEASEATIWAKNAAIKAVRLYFAELKDNAANELFKEQLTGVKDFAINIFNQMFGALSAIFTAITNERLSELDRWLQAELEAAGLLEETTLERLQRELDAAIESGDQETEADLRKQIKKEEILLEYEKEKAKIEYEGELRSWRIQLLSTISQSFQAALNAYSSAAAIPLIGFLLGPIAAAAATAFGKLQISAVRKSKPKPPGAKTGGIVVPKTGGTELNVAENRASELLLNGGAEGEAFLNEFAQKIADIVNAGNGSGITIPVHLYMDGKKVAQSSAKYYNNGIVRIDI